MSREIVRKIEVLKECIKPLRQVMVAFSGGIDSSLVAYVSGMVLGSGAIAVTSASQSLKRSDLALSKSLAETWGLTHHIIKTEELKNPRYAENSTDRCYHCKSTLYGEMANLAKELDVKFLLNGTNVDDLGDYRPGLQAASEHEIKSPLLDAGFTKKDVREAALYLGIENALKPQSPCLSSRVPYGTHISSEILKKIESAEEILMFLGFNEFRVRHHGEIARLEVSNAEFSRAVSCRAEIAEGIKKCGYEFVSLDLCDFASGSLNRSINVQESVVKWVSP